MTDYQFTQLHKALTELLEGIQKLEIIQDEIKGIFADYRSDAVKAKSNIDEPE